jgi:hypothetical protein
MNKKQCILLSILLLMSILLANEDAKSWIPDSKIPGLHTLTNAIQYLCVIIGVYLNIIMC